MVSDLYWKIAKKTLTAPGLEPETSPPRPTVFLPPSNRVVMTVFASILVVNRLPICLVTRGHQSRTGRRITFSRLTVGSFWGQGVKGQKISSVQCDVRDGDGVSVYVKAFERPCWWVALVYKPTRELRNTGCEYDKHGLIGTQHTQTVKASMQCIFFLF